MAAPKSPQFGEKRFNAKLTDEDIALIRELRSERERLRAEAAQLSDMEIARKFDVHPNTIWKIGARVSWYRAR